MPIIRKISKTDLSAQIALQHGSTSTAARATIDAFLDLVAGHLAEGDEVHLNGFGKFYTRQNAPRKGRNPATGEAMQIPASTSVGFKPAKQLKDSVN